jgi:Rrf2 family protein
MLSLTKKTDYALISLGFLADHTDRTISAREIADAFNLPTALVMNILKTLHQHKFLTSSRGARGGYRLAADLSRMSICDLIVALEGPVRLAECVVIESDCAEPNCCKIAHSCPIRQPVQALHQRLIQFLSDVKIADLLQNHPHIDVPVNKVGVI